MTKGHIQIGFTPDAMKDYLLTDPNQRVRSRFSPMATKLGQGAEQFNDFTSHQYWEISNWAKGIGYNANAGVEGAYLYGEVDSRGGTEFILPPLLTVFSAESNSDVSPTINNIQNGFRYSVEAPAKIAISFYMDAPGDIYVYLEHDGVATVTINQDNAGEPGTQLWAGALISTSTKMGADWMHCPCDFTPVEGTLYWLVLEDGNSAITPFAMQGTLPSGELLCDMGGVWEPVLINSTSTYVPYIAGSGQLGNIVAAQTVAGKLFTLGDDGKVFEWNGATNTFELFADTGATSYDMQAWFGRLVVSHGSFKLMDSVDIVTAAITPLTVNGKLLTVWNGYLWKSHGNVASYSGENITVWVDVEVGPSDYEIRGMVGLADDLLVSTDQMIWRIAPGDWVYSLSRWAYESARNGKNMINNQGVAFIPADNSLTRLQVNAPFLNIWNREETLPADKSGVIDGVIGTNKEVIAYINPVGQSGQSTAWSFNNQGWHHVCKAPVTQRITLMHYDNTNDSIWFFTDSGHAYRFYASSTSSNPLTDSLTTFTPNGFVDMGEYHGGLQTIEKDFDGVTVVGKNITPTRALTIYWRDPDVDATEYIWSEDGEVILAQDGEPLLESQTGWSTLGKITESGQTLRWEDYNVRPTGVGLRLAYSIETSDIYTSPEISAVVVKFVSHVIDQFQFQYPIVVSDRQTMIDGSRDTRTAVEIMNELEAYDVNRLLPVWIRDIWGRLFECKVIGFAERTIKFETMQDGTPDIYAVVDLTLREIAAQDPRVPIDG